MKGLPQVIGTWPQDGEENVNVKTKIEIQFTDVMDEDTLNDRGIFIFYCDTKQIIESRYKYEEENYTLIITPSISLKPGVEVAVVLTDFLKDKEGEMITRNAKQGTSEEYRYVFMFKTKSGH